MKELTLKVKMHCKSCEIIITDILTDAGIDILEISATKNLIKLRFDENKINESEIKAIIEKEGYKVK
ncbi:heavy-metal-associated domain-containing protein [Candidatus Woesearchaeota archaeon]|nr:heavy-metal-associated domain-containing protein [Candidatus Woesearchaeota archaeon]